MNTTVWHVTKNEAVAERAMVAAKHPAVVAAGLDVLRRGGNAVDAAVAMSFAIGVAEPAGSGIGGGGLMIYHRATDRRTFVVDFAMDAPRAATPDAYQLEDGVGANRFGWRGVKGDANQTGYRAVAVPGQVAGLTLALERFGTIPLADALAPAIRLADEGVDVEWPLTVTIAMNMPIFARFPASAAIYCPDGLPLCPSDGVSPPQRLVQRDLARTLRRVAERGADGFYQGETARTIGDAMREHGGLLTEEDLASFRATIHDGGQVSRYRGHEIVGVPGACGCVTAQQALTMLDHLDLAAHPPGSVASLHRHAEAYRLAWADRHRYVGDPKQATVPYGGLLSREYARARAARFDPGRAAPTVEPGDPWAHDPAGRPASGAAGRPGRGDSSTAHLAAVDERGDVVALTQTLVNRFGSGVVVPGTGVMMNDAMLWLDPEPGRPNSIAPGKRGLNNMTPLLVLREGAPVLAVGAPGGAKIVNAMTQIISNVLDHGMGPQDAIAAPRLDCSSRDVLVDSRLPAAVVEGLAALGHRVRVVEENFYIVHFSTPLAIAIDPASGTLRGGVDPFRLAIAAGY